MVKKIITCDKCLKNILESERFQYIGKVKDPAGDLHESKYDFCPICYDIVTKFMTSSEENVEVIPPSAEQLNALLRPSDGSDDEIDSHDDDSELEDDYPEATAESSSRRSRIDIGKMIALHNAGWRNKDIAEEMGMTPLAVSQTFYRVRNGAVKKYPPSALIENNK